MKNLFNVFLITFSLFISTSAFASFTVPAPTGNVVDTSGKLTDDQKVKIQERLTSINNSSKNEIGVLVVPSLEGTEPAAAGLMVFDSWKIGKKGLDNGVLLLVAVNDHKIRVATGKGVEGDLTDLQSNDIIKNDIAPEFKRGDFYQGIMNGVDKINSTLESRAPKPVAQAPVAETHTTATTDSSGVNSSLIGFGLLGGFITMVGGLIFFVRNEEKKARLEQMIRDEEEERMAREHEAEEVARNRRKYLIDQERAADTKRAMEDAAKVKVDSHKPITNSAPMKIPQTLPSMKAVVHIKSPSTVPRPESLVREVKTDRECAAERAEKARQEEVERETRAQRAEQHRREENARRIQRDEDERKSRREEEERSSRSSSNDSVFGGFDSGSSGGGFDFGGGGSNGGGSDGSW